MIRNPLEDCPDDNYDVLHAEATDRYYWVETDDEGNPTSMLNGPFETADAAWQAAMNSRSK